jgi:2-phospho-L-lactate guanylyltransferase (CobY/MobA/RfbA family)
MDLSIIIPVARRENDFKLIKQLREKFKGCEIIIVSDENNEFIKSAKLQVDQLYFLKNSLRAKALNKGANLSNRKNLWFLHLDSNVEHIQLSDLTGLDEFTVSTFLLKFDQKNCWWIAAGANFRTKTFGIPFGDQSFLMSKKLFNFIGGFDENLSLGEDHEFIWRIKSLNIKLNIINKKIITSAIKYENKKIYQSLKTLWKTILQAIKFYQEKKTVVLGTFLKDPQSPESKSRLRKVLSDKFVNELNLKFINIINENLKKLKRRKEIHFIKVCRVMDEEKLNSFSNIYQGKFINEDQGLNLIMSEVSELSLKTVGKVALLGSDIPALTVEDLDEAFSKRLNKSSYFFSTRDGGFCLMISNSQNVVQCLSKIKSSITSVMQKFTECLGEVELAKKVFNDVDVIADLKEVYDEFKLVEVSLSDEQKDLLNFLRINKNFFI